jgi:hypothetical protein
MINKRFFIKRISNCTRSAADKDKADNQK